MVIFKKMRKEDEMKERISKLLTIKSLVTLALTAVFMVITLRGYISSEQFLTIFTVVISFYFGTQAAKQH